MHCLSCFQTFHCSLCSQLVLRLKHFSSNTTAQVDVLFCVHLFCKHLGTAGWSHASVPCLFWLTHRFHWPVNDTIREPRGCPLEGGHPWAQCLELGWRQPWGWGRAGPQLGCWPSAAAVEAGAGLNPDGIRGEGSQVMKGLLGGHAFRQLQERGADETVSQVRDGVPPSLRGTPH